MKASFAHMLALDPPLVCHRFPTCPQLLKVISSMKEMGLEVTK